MSGQRSSKDKPSADSEERLLDDLAAGHLGELSRRAGGGGSADVRPAEAPSQAEERTDTAAEQDKADAEDAPKRQDAEVDPAKQGLSDENRQGEQEGPAGGKVDELLSAVERIAGRQPARARQKNPLLAPADARRRFSLKLPPRVRVVLLQSAAVGAGVAGALLLAWLMFA